MPALINPKRVVIVSSILLILLPSGCQQMQIVLHSQKDSGGAADSPSY